MLYKLMYGRERLAPDETFHVELSTKADYNLAAENHIEQLVKTQLSNVQ